MVAERHHPTQQRPARSSCSLAGRRGPWLADAGLVWEPEAVMALLLAHQGGWDEMLFVAVPIVIFGSLLAIANRRASRIEKQQPANGESSPGDEPG
jgi:hypothetical protein